MKQKNPRKARTVTRGSAADAAPGTGGTLSRAGAPAYTTFLIVLMHILGSYRERERERVRDFWRLFSFVCLHVLQLSFTISPSLLVCIRTVLFTDFAVVGARASHQGL